MTCVGTAYIFGVKEWVMTKEEREAFYKKVDAEINNLLAETSKLNAETDKMRLERVLYPMVVASGATLAIVAIVKLFL